MRNETSSEFSVLVLVHLREIEVIFVELFAYLLPKSRLTGSQYLTDISTVCSIVTDEISIQLSWCGSGEAVVEE